MRPECARGVAVATGLLLLFAAAGSAARADIIDGSAIVARTLDNGVQVIVKPDHDAPLVAICAIVRGGSAAEGPGERALAHTLEHMIFQRPARGTPTGLLPETIEGLGGEVLAATTRDFTRFTVTVATDGFADALAALAQALSQPEMEPDRLSGELNVIQKELDGIYSDPGTALRDAAYAAIYPDGPYAHSPGGGPEKLPAITIEQLRSFHARNYVGHNISVTIVGDVDPTAALDLASGKFAALAPGEDTLPQPGPAPAAKPGEVTVKGPGGGLVALAFPAPGTSEWKDVLATDVLLSTVDNGDSSRLHVLYPRAAPGSGQAGADFLTQRLPGILVLWGAVGGADQAQALNALKAVLADLRDRQPSEEETLRGARGARVLHALSCDTCTGQAETIAFYAANATYRLGVDYEHAVLEVTPSEVTDVVRRYFDPDKAVVLREPAERGPAQ